MTDDGSAARATAAATGVTGLAVALVVLQSSGGFAVELLGPDVLLTVTGFALTRRLLRPGPVLWPYYRTLMGRFPLLVVTVGVVLAVATLAVGCRLDGFAVAAAMLAAANWWQLLGPSPAPLACGVPGALVDVDPLGAMWLVAVLVQLCLGWPVLFAAGHGLVRSLPRGRGLVGGALMALAVAAALAVGPLRAMQGATPAELTLGTHVRLGEFVIGAAAAVLVAGLHRRHPPGGARAARGAVGHVRAPSGPTRTVDDARTAGTYAAGTLVTLTVAGVALLVASAAVTWLAPGGWLRLGGPVSAALGTAVVLLGVTLAPDGGLTRATGRGLPLELGRSAPTLLVVHLPVFWLLQLAVPQVRPFALVVVGGVLAWLGGLLLHDGALRRLLAGRGRVAAWCAVVLLAAGVAAGAQWAGRLQSVEAAPGPGGVLVVGGTRAAGIAAALRDGPRPVVDASVRGCGLLDVGATPSTARTTATAQLPTDSTAAACGGWEDRWAGDIAAGAPVAVVADLTDDAGPHPPGDPPGPCDAAFRPLYRDLLDRAAAVWTAGDPARPVLVVLPDATDAPGRCLTALLGDAVARQYALVPARDTAGDAVLAAVDEALEPAATAARTTGAAAACRNGPAETVTTGC